MTESQKREVHIEKEALTKWELISNEEIIEKTNWIVLEYESDNNLKLRGFGPKGVLEGKKLLKDDAVAFLIIRGCHALGLSVIHIDIIIQWLPPQCSTFDRAKSTFHVDHIVNQLSLDHFFILDCSNLSMLENEYIEKKIRTSTKHTGGKFAFDGNTVVLRRKRQKSIIELNRRKELKDKGKEHDRQREINVFQEIYDTEKAYVDQMGQFYENYVKPMKEANLNFYNMLVTNVKLILDINRPFLESMKDCSFRNDNEGKDKYIEEEEEEEEGGGGGGEEGKKKDGNATIDDTQKIRNVAKLVELLVNQCPVFKLYLPYINVYTKLVKKAKDLISEDEKFGNFCRATKQNLEKIESRNTDIYGFLIMPIQRIPRYQLLMRELHRKTDKNDPNFLSIQEGLNKVGEIARYIDSKKNENEMAQKTIEISKKYKIKDLVDMHRKMKKNASCNYSPGSSGKGKPAEILIFNDLIIICGYHPKKFVRVNLCDMDVRVFPSEKEDDAFILETERKRHRIILKRMKNRDFYVEYIRTSLVVNCSQTMMSNKFQGREIFQSYLQKEGGGTFSYNVKKRYHVLTTDYKMKYYDSPGGKFKGSYSLFGAKIGRGKDIKMRKRAGLGKLIGRTKSLHELKAISISVKKECWFYIKTRKRTYFLLAKNVVMLDTWVKILELIGCERKDVLDWEEENWQKQELEKLKSRDAIGASLQLDENDFDLPDMFSSSPSTSSPSSSEKKIDQEEEEENEGEGEEEEEEKLKQQKLLDVPQQQQQQQQQKSEESLIKVNIDVNSLEVRLEDMTSTTNVLSEEEEENEKNNKQIDVNINISNGIEEEEQQQQSKINEVEENLVVSVEIVETSQVQIVEEDESKKENTTTTTTTETTTTTTAEAELEKEEVDDGIKDLNVIMEGAIQNEIEQIKFV